MNTNEKFCPLKHNMSSAMAPCTKSCALAVSTEDPNLHQCAIVRIAENLGRIATTAEEAAADYELEEVAE